jgi:hypothetical protein
MRKPLRCPRNDLRQTGFTASDGKMAMGRIPDPAKRYLLP